MTTTLDKLIAENQFPVVFIGSGMSRRFLENFPDWTGLLHEFWESIGLENFYGSLNNLWDELSQANPSLGERELAHYANIKTGSYLEKQYNKAFNNKLITIDGFSTTDAHRTRISPFKKAIANRFNQYKIKSDMQHEYKSFVKMLMKTQIVLTTNYDSFIEDSFNEFSEYAIEKYIGQSGFFERTHGFAELYKIHGCVSSPEKIMISEKDYKKFDADSVLISAKIISMMINSPIILWDIL
ncbi:SIR2 family protein [Litoribacterium kuwaitense]|uniref:SIR2 family protein n=1 Tax=Litoribacterium kuwaitense TaxID=1398745 RepID=UPI001FEC7E9F|nr:SIR2 family protein [Litoribacterium kuwaitense]